MLTSVVFTAFNGLYIRKNGDMVFVPDFRIKKIKIAEIERISINFNEWENRKYSISLKFKYYDGRVFTKDYASQFRRLTKKHIRKSNMAAYTIKKYEVENICRIFSEIDKCVLTVIDQNGEIVFQEKKV